MPDLHNRRVVRADQLKVIQMALSCAKVFPIVRTGTENT
jgi:hypothetical protein